MSDRAESESPLGSTTSDRADSEPSVSDKQGRGRKRGTTTENWVPAKQTKRYKESHKATEKHRRDKINVSLGMLADLIPQCKNKSTKPDKLTILSQTVDYIKSLRQSSSLGASTSGTEGSDDQHKPSCRLDQEWRRLLLYNIDDLFHVCTPNGTIVDILPSCKTVLGYDQTELMNVNLRALLHPHDVQHVMAHIENPDIVNIEFVARYQKKSGEYVWLSVKGRREAITGQKPFILGVGRIYDRQQAAPDSYDEYYVKYALNGTCTYASANVRAVLGFAPEDVVMKDMADLVPPDEFKEIWGETLEFVDGQSQLRVNHRMMTSSGEYRWVESIMWPFLNPISRAPEFFFGRTRTSVGPFHKVIEPLQQEMMAPPRAAPSVGLSRSQSHQGSGLFDVGAVGPPPAAAGGPQYQRGFVATPGSAPAPPPPPHRRGSLATADGPRPVPSFAAAAAHAQHHGPDVPYSQGQRGRVRRTHTAPVVPGPEYGAFDSQNGPPLQSQSSQQFRPRGMYAPSMDDPLSSLGSYSNFHR